MRKIVLFFLFLISVFFLASCTRVSLDPELPAIVDASSFDPLPEPIVEESRLIKAETTVVKDERQTHMIQYYEYDNGLLTRAYAPEGTLAARSEIPHIWDLIDMDIREVEETYQYDKGNRLVRIEGREPEELDDAGYVISFWYEEDHVARELLLVGDDIISIDFEYDGPRLIGAYCSTGANISYTYKDDGRLYIVTVLDNGITSKQYHYAETSVLNPIESEEDYVKYAYVDGLEVKINCFSATNPYSELRDYDLDGKLLYVSRDYDNGISSFTRYYYE